MGAALAIGGGLVSAFSSYQQGKAQEANFEYNAQVARNNAIQTEQEGRENVRRGFENAEEQLASVRARQAAGGSISTQGAPLAVTGEIATELQLGILDNYRQTEIQRVNFLNDAAISSFQGEQASRSGLLQGAAGLVSTATTAFDNFSSGRSSGAFG